jgi:hypothetical protein
LPNKTNSKDNQFNDIASLSSSIKDDINWLYQYGITTGTTPTTYSPAEQVTRGQMAVFLYRLAGSPTYNTTACGFADITGGYKRAASAICWLKQMGVTKGVTATLYGPEQAVTRAQMATFMYRLAGSPAYNTTTCGFTDISNQPDEIKKSICFLKSIAATTGITPSIYAPASQVTRAQMAAFMHRLYVWAVR